MATTTRDNEQLVRRFTETVWRDHDFDAIDEFVADDAVLHDNLNPEPIRGPDGARGFAESVLSAFPDVQVETLDLVAEDDRVAHRFRATGTHEGEFLGAPPTGDEVSVTGIAIRRIEDGQFVEEWEVLDALGLFRQLGVVELPE